MQYIGKINREILGEFRGRIITDEVVLTEERMRHIVERHPGDFEKYGKYMDEIIQMPDYVLEDTKNDNTVILLKSLQDCDKNIQLIIKLSTNNNDKRDKNSILSFWKVRNSTFQQMIRNKKILYKNE